MPTMEAPVSLASELTTMERIEHLLTVLACSVTGQPAHRICPWMSAGIENFRRAVKRG
jgi:hypothetical protein